MCNRDAVGSQTTAFRVAVLNFDRVDLPARRGAPKDSLAMVSVGPAGEIVSVDATTKDADDQDGRRLGTEGSVPDATK